LFYFLQQKNKYWNDNVLVVPSFVCFYIITSRNIIARSVDNCCGVTENLSEIKPFNVPLVGAGSSGGFESGSIEIICLVCDLQLAT